MKKNTLIWLASTLFIIVACSNEEITSSEDLGIVDRFSPPPGEDPRITSLYEQYGVWIRMSMKNPREIYNSFVSSDQISGRYDALEVDPADRSSAITYAETLLNNVSAEFTRTFFPLEWYLVKSYGGNLWISHFNLIGRNRLVLCWPNQAKDALPVTDPANHYYQDSLLTANVWNYIAQACAHHFENGLDEFSCLGKPYDEGEAAITIRNQYHDSDIDKYDELIKELCVTGGFISSGGSNSFASDFISWMMLLTMESYENIKVKYLDNSKPRREKYEMLISFFNSYNWDIQATGDNYRRKYNEYLASLPDDEEEEEEEEEEPEEEQEEKPEVEEETP